MTREIAGYDDATVAEHLAGGEFGDVEVPADKPAADGKAAKTEPEAASR